MTALRAQVVRLEQQVSQLQQTAATSSAASDARWLFLLGFPLCMPSKFRDPQITS